MRKLAISCVLVYSVTQLLGCAADDPNRRAKTGAAIGAVSGAVLGHQISHKNGKFVGAAVGAIAGVAIGDYMDKQQADFDKALAQEKQQNAMQVERVQDDLLKLSLNSEVSFDFDKADIKPSFAPSLDKLADILKKYDRSEVLVVGHTDNVGKDSYNMKLSQRRADAVVAYFVQRGVGSGRLKAEGRGETEPRDTNDTPEGRQLNRRVEVFVKPIPDSGTAPPG